MLAVGVQLPEPASYTSALARADELSLEALPPTTRTCPFANGAAPCPQRAWFRLPVPCQPSPPLVTAGDGLVNGSPDDAEGSERASDDGADVERATGLDVGAPPPGRVERARAPTTTTDTTAIETMAMPASGRLRDRTADMLGVRIGSDGAPGIGPPRVVEAGAAPSIAGAAGWIAAPLTISVAGSGGLGRVGADPVSAPRASSRSSAHDP